MMDYCSVCANYPVACKDCYISSALPEPSKFQGLKLNKEIECEVKEPVEQKKDKPRICEVLGVEVGEKFTFAYPHREYETVSVREDGTVWEYQERYNKSHKLGHIALCWLINHPESIQHLPRLTQSELKICMAIPGVKYISMDKEPGMPLAQLWDGKPRQTKGGLFRGTDSSNFIGGFVPDMFPSLRHGDCICVEE